MSRYQLGQEVEGIVESVLPFGVFLRLGDRTKAYVRRRELALDPDLEPSQTVRKGDLVKAMVIGLEKPDKCLELSRRNLLGDNWQDFLKSYRENSVIEGCVQSLHPHGVFVRVAPGIRGFVPLNELSEKTIARPEELLWVEDRVEAVITRIDSNRKRVWLSVKTRLRQRERALEVFDQVGGGADESSDPVITIATPETGEMITPEVCALVGPILVVDDHTEVRDSLAAWLRQHGCEVAQAGSLAEAFPMLNQKNWGLILVDLNLLDCDGLDLVRRARKHESQACICVMSSPDSLAERAAEIEEIEVSQVFPKPLDLCDLEQFFLRLANGETIKPWRAEHKQETDKATVFPDLTFIEAQEETPIQRLQTALSWMTESLRAQAGAIFWMNPASQVISSLAQVGLSSVNRAASYGLNDSPVKDVIREGNFVFENRIDEKSRARFARLLDYFNFESCLGVPVKSLGEVQHTAFFFHREPDAFSRENLRSAYVGAALFSALLTEDALDRRVQLLHPILLSGELGAGIGHEVANKISGLEIQARNLLRKISDPGYPPGNSIDHSPKDYSKDSLKSDVTRVLDLTLDMKETVGAFQQLSRVNQSQLSGGGCDLNLVLQRAEALLRPIAGKDGVRIDRRYDPHLPKVAGNPIVLQQVFINLMLNAIQQMAIKDGDHRVLAINASIAQGQWPIQVRFWDSGPGIHRQLWEKIFSPGFSTRGGSGLGLFIARSFVQSLGGRLRVEESFIPLGTTFLVELPGAEEGTGK